MSGLLYAWHADYDRKRSVWEMAGDVNRSLLDFFVAAASLIDSSPFMLRESMSGPFRIYEQRRGYLMHRAFMPICTLFALTLMSGAVRGDETDKPLRRDYTIPVVDLAGETERQVIVDREPGQYLGHPTTVLLEDNQTMICVNPPSVERFITIAPRPCP